MGPLEKARSPVQEPVEPHGAGRGSRPKDNGPIEPGTQNQESIGLLRIPLPLDLDGAPYQQPVGPKSERGSLHQETTRPLWKTLGPLEITGVPDQKPMGP